MKVMRTRDDEEKRGMVRRRRHNGEGIRRMGKND